MLFRSYQLEVDDYLFLDCRPAELWRRVAACLERLPGKRKNVGAASRSLPLNRGILKKVAHMCQYLCYSLESSRATLQSLINAPEADLDGKWRPKIQEVSARLEIMEEMMQGLRYGMSGQGLSHINRLRQGTVI